ncbi:FAD-dependent oxidoreductase [soil metagenome]
MVGGGLAGVAATVALAERGLAVTLHEAEDHLGGRLGGWADTLATGEPFEMDRGFHAVFRQYYNLRRLLRRVDPELAGLTPIDDYPLVGPGGAVESFAGLPQRPPFNLFALVRRTPTLGWRELRRVDAGAALHMLRYDPVTTYQRFDAISATGYLDSIGFPDHARQMLFDVFAHSFFNPEDEMSAAELLMMFHLYFLGSSEGLLFDVLDEAFSDAVWTPMARYLRSLGVDLRLGSTVDAIEGGGSGGWVVSGEPADAVVLALPVQPLRAVVAASPDVGAGDPAWREAVDRLAPAPPFAVWRLWLDRPTRADRAPFVGTAGLGIIDNISCVHRYQGAARRWAARTGGSVVELHAYALDPTRDDASTKAELRARLHELYPETAAAGVVDERWLVRADCPAFRPGSAADRPGVTTPEPTVALAGDLVQLPFPSALMERAAASGFLAANHLLARWGLEQEPVWSIPPRGILAGRNRRIGGLGTAPSWMRGMGLRHRRR